MTSRYKDPSAFTPDDFLRHQRGERIPSDEYTQAIRDLDAEFTDDIDDDENSPASHLRRLQGR